TFSGTTARMIQHEYDHTEGILYLDYLKPLTKKLLEAKLKKIARGHIKTRNPMKFVRRYCRPQPIRPQHHEASWHLSEAASLSQRKSRKFQSLLTNAQWLFCTYL